MFDQYLTLWALVPDGAPIITHTGRLLPVRYEGTPAILKITADADEQRGGLLMDWWDGDGAARVLAHDGDAVLLERAQGNKSLITMARTGDDDDACRVLCQAAARLHLPRNLTLPPLVPLTKWFRELKPFAATYGGILSICHDTAQTLLAHPREVAVLHGDIHHGNVLDFGTRGWLVIDPKGLHGERGFDYANIFCNPDLDTAAAPGALARRATVVAQAAGLERKRLLQWALAYAGLSAAWCLEDSAAPDLPLHVAAQADAELSKC